MAASPWLCTAELEYESDIAVHQLDALKAAGYEVMPRGRLVDTIIKSGLLSVSFLKQGAAAVFPEVERVIDAAAGEQP